MSWSLTNLLVSLLLTTADTDLAKLTADRLADVATRDPTKVTLVAARDPTKVTLNTGRFILTQTYIYEMYSLHFLDI